MPTADTVIESLRKLPEGVREDLARYFLFGDQPGGFLTAVLENNLIGAFSRGDSTAAALLPILASWIYNYLPKAAWGGMKVEKWVDHDGLCGLDATHGGISRDEGHALLDAMLAKEAP